LRDAPPKLRIDAAFPLVKETTSDLLESAVAKPERLLMADERREPKSFRIALTREMGVKRGKTSGSFVYEAKQQVAEFYRLVVQRLKPWQAGAPKLPSPPEEGVAEASPRPPDFTAETTREPGEGLDPETMAGDDV